MDRVLAFPATERNAVFVLPAFKEDVILVQATLVGGYCVGSLIFILVLVFY